jgi:hypothetical protein
LVCISIGYWYVSLLAIGMYLYWLLVCISIGYWYLYTNICLSVLHSKEKEHRLSLICVMIYATHVVRFEVVPESSWVH